MNPSSNLLRLLEHQFALATRDLFGTEQQQQEALDRLSFIAICSRQSSSYVGLYTDAQTLVNRLRLPRWDLSDVSTKDLKARFLVPSLLHTSYLESLKTCMDATEQRQAEIDKLRSDSQQTAEARKNTVAILTTLAGLSLPALSNEVDEENVNRATDNVELRRKELEVNFLEQSGKYIWLIKSQDSLQSSSGMRESLFGRHR